MRAKRVLEDPRRTGVLPHRHRSLPEIDKPNDAAFQRRAALAYHG